MAQFGRLTRQQRKKMRLNGVVIPERASPLSPTPVSAATSTALRASDIPSATKDSAKSREEHIMLRNNIIKVLVVMIAFVGLLALTSQLDKRYNYLAPISRTLVEFLHIKL